MLRGVALAFSLVVLSGVCLAGSVYPSKFRCETGEPFGSSSCSRHYFECKNQHVALATCPEYLVFNPALVACDMRKNLPTCAESRMLVNDNVFVCPGDGFYPSTEGSCTRNYFVCSFGDAYLESCPQGYVFDPSVTRCVAETSCQAYNCQSNGYFPYTGSCSKFWICADGTPYAAECPPGLFFDPALSKCTVAQNDQSTC